VIQASATHSLLHLLTANNHCKLSCWASEDKSYPYSLFIAFPQFKFSPLHFDLLPSRYPTLKASGSPRCQVSHLLRKTTTCYSLCSFNLAATKPATVASRMYSSEYRPEGLLQLKDVKRADFVVICDEAKFEVHKVIVGSWSGFFKGCIDGQFKVSLSLARKTRPTC
jgi:hypothetical protein